MLTIRAHEAGPSSVMKLVEVDTPKPGPGELLVRVEAAGVNFIDIYQRSGQYKIPLPIPLGLEGAGVVEARGEGVSEHYDGERVAWASAAGSYATHAIVASANAIHVPDGVSLEVAAAAMLQGMTAHYLATSTYPLGPSDTCLVHAAAGGVGLLLCQLAKRKGAHVIGTVSTAEKAARAKAAGADVALIHGQERFEVEARVLTQDRGVDVVYDSIGKDTFMRSLDALKRRGMMVLYGQSSGAVPPIDPQILAQKGALFLTRPTLHHYVATREELTQRAGAVLGAIERGELTIAIDSKMKLADAAAAHDRLASRSTIGKVLLIP